MASTLVRLSLAFCAIACPACLSQHHAESVTSSEAFETRSASESSAYGRTRNVAIIGAGSAGASTAYYLQNYLLESYGLTANITVFERSDYIGGRSTTVNVWDDPDFAVELGASIFVKVNRNLYDAAQDFGLPIDDAGANSPNEAPLALGIWDGEDFRYVQRAGRSYWWDVGKLVWKYGRAPLRTHRLMQKTVEKLLAMYEAPIFPFRSLSDAVAQADLIDTASVTGTTVLKKHGIGPPFSTDIIQASTRVNYAQNLGEIHGLETMVCMAAEGAVSIPGGNWQIFEGMLQAARAHLLLNASVTHISKAQDSTYSLTYETHDGPTTDGDFDHVVIAAPLQFTKLAIDPLPPRLPSATPYVDLHVTLLASPHRLSPLAFGLPLLQPPPEVILTTLPGGRDRPSDPSADATAPAGFFSISTLRKLTNKGHTPPRPEYVYKIFSPRPVNATLLASLLGFLDPGVPALADIPAADVSWVQEHAWQSYPYEAPRQTFDPVALDDDGLWYTAGMEGLISTMETNSLAGRNVARLIADRWEAEMAEEEAKEAERELEWAKEQEAERKAESEL